MCRNFTFIEEGTHHLLFLFPPPTVRNWLEGEKGQGRSSFKFSKEEFSNACYLPQILRVWRGSLVKSRLSLWWIRRIPCILGNLIYISARSSPRGLALAFCTVSSAAWIERNSLSHTLFPIFPIWGYPKIIRPGSISFCLWSSWERQGAASKGV